GARGRVGPRALTGTARARLAMSRRGPAATLLAIAAIAGCGGGGGATPPSAGSSATTGPAPVERDRLPHPRTGVDVYAADVPGRFARAARGVPARVYVPNSQSDTVDVIDQRSGRIVRHFAVGRLPQHVVPSYDLRTLWVTNDAGNSLTPIDPRTSRPGRPVHVLDPYNMYFTADGRRAIVVAEAHRELDFREPHTMRLRTRLHVPGCE